MHLYSIKQPTKLQQSLETEVHIVLVLCCGHPVIHHLCNRFVFIICDFQPAAQCCGVRKLDSRLHSNCSSYPSVLINHQLAADILIKKIRTLKQQLCCGSVIDLSFEFCFNLLKLIIINLIIQGAERK